MIIKCPNCSATYDVPSAAAVHGRKVRCTRCAHVWRAEVIDEGGSVAAAPMAAPAAPADAPAFRQHSVAPVPPTAQLGRPMPPPSAHGAPAAVAPAAVATGPTADDHVPHNDHDYGRDSHSADQDQDNRNQSPGDGIRNSDVAPAVGPAVRPQAPAAPPTRAVQNTELAKAERAAAAVAAAAVAARVHGSPIVPDPDAQPTLRAVPSPSPVANGRATRGAGVGRIEPETDGRQASRPELRSEPRLGTTSKRDARNRPDAWEEVEDSLSKVTRSSGRTEQRPPLQERQPSRPSGSDEDWHGARAATGPVRNGKGRPGLDDEQFWRARATPAGEGWPTVEDVGADLPTKPRRPRGGVVVTLGWLLFAGIVVSLITFLYVGRTTVVKALPGAAPIYASAGLPVNVRGLEFRNVSYKWGIDRKGRPALTVAGTVVNITDQPQTVPSVAFVFLDAEQAELFNWATPIRDTPLPPGKSTSFEARIPAPPEAVANLQLRFARLR